MAEPVIEFGFNHTGLDVPWSYNGTNSKTENGWMEITPSNDKIIFTGGGIIGMLPTPTCASGTRDATIKPSGSSYKIPQTYVEKDQMYITKAGYNTNRYVFAVHCYGTASSDLYAEMWDDSSLSTTNIELLTGTANNSYNSCVNAIRTTYVEPPFPWNGASAGAAYLRGVSQRVALNNASTVVNKSVYFNIFVELPTDCSTWHALPCLAIRYLYT